MNAKWHPWFKARSVLWEACVRESSVGKLRLTKSMAQLDLAYLDQTAQAPTIRELARRWNWGTSTVHRFLSEMGGGTTGDQEPNKSGTRKPAKDSASIEVGRTPQEHHRNKEETRPTYIEKRKEKILSLKQEPKKSKPVGRKKKPAKNAREKQMVFAIFCEEYKSAYSASYERESRDVWPNILNVLVEKIEADEDRFRVICRRYIHNKKNRIGWNPPGPPTISQLANYYNSYASEDHEPVAVRGEYEDIPIDEDKKRRKVWE